MTRFDTTVVGAINPRLQVGKDKMDHRQMLLCLLWVTAEGKRIVPITYFAKPVISMPAVSANDGASRYVVLDECCECFGVATRKRNISLFNVRYNAKPEAPRISEFLGGDAAFVGILPFRPTILGILARPNFNSANYHCLMV